ncbi:armadillo-type protein [Mycena latifolia]|nr:armadillo-type protein [Mycena latifolia]
MPSLARQPTRESIHSWWSDRNLPGPTINLHAAAKPLMRFMYGRQALAFIKTQRWIPLSKEAMEIYASYLAYGTVLLFKYVSPSTKTAILGELERRATSPYDARAVVDSAVLNLVHELLGSPNAMVRRSTCRLLGKLVRDPTVATVLGTTSCVDLVAILRDTNLEVLESAMYALSRITQWPDGAQAVLTAKILDYFESLLASPNTQVRRLACTTLGHLTYHGPTAVVVRRIAIRLLLFPLLCHRACGTGSVFDRRVGRRDRNLGVIASAAEALSLLVHWPDGAQATVDSKFLNCVPTLLESPGILVQRWTCNIVGELARHSATAMAILAVSPCAKLISFLGDTDLALRASALFALAQISESPVGVKALAPADILCHVGALMDSPDRQVQLQVWAKLIERHGVSHGNGQRAS